MVIIFHRSHTDSCVLQSGLISKPNSIVAASSSPRPWTDAFALPEKFKMAVTESDLDLKVRKMSIMF